ncbi:Prefoldin subunit-domain-containing protein [Melampsora americana]|nr:Prefoldin subunit-domain-containing protein [Melampsora americana]
MATPKSGPQLTTKIGPRGIPEAIFIEDVESHLGGPDGDAEKALVAWQDMIAYIGLIRKYQFMEKSTVKKKMDLEQKIPELESTLETVEILQNKKDAEEVLETHFELADTLYTSAVIEPVEEVYLWLGANTMMAYPLAEARELLSEKIEAAKARLAQTVEEHAFLRNQLTTSQVNVARVYNWDVKRRKERKAREEALGTPSITTE